jgi:hypothetical protein
MVAMSELRHRPPETAPAPDRPPQPDAPRQADRHTTRQPAADARPARDDVPHYDADAQSKHPVAKSDDYHRDGTGGTASQDTTQRTRGDWTTRRDDPSLTWRKDPAGAPPLREGKDTGRADTLHTVVDRPDCHNPDRTRAPNRYGDPFTRPDGSKIPCLDGPPRREQTAQGWAGDCGIIAALGAVAGHRPEDITRRIQPRDDGSYQVTLSEAHWSGAISEPTGRDIELTVTPEVPVFEEAPGVAACAQPEEETTWCPLMEKAFAGVDQTWTAERRAEWENDWAGICAQDQARNVENPRSGPTPNGYARLHQGTTPGERAEALTQLTGQPAVVREFPSGRDEWTINRVIRAQLAEGKPVLVDSRRKTHDKEQMPHRLESGHVYEVIGVEQGKILLRNPWNRRHPEPMETGEFARNMSRYYSTLM